ncbi:dihydrodipicolinate synthase [Saccharothrix sp. NRRL B-16348]|uniref:dihydrodipicolinate synthase family protein n=1 Tax=Saccharothrix sp. NRRL B-16348 TaxID=1415542 RepID=UPI0006ADEFBA|nr:dihydrodipicolinate synthase family protein [Saccharothrix sp. NRRL B-16348]KOX21026.1 dihydrodipicolinate synthase [Saccharothrix sp. NRRL B-16348]
MTLTGLHVPLITPFDRSGAVALDALEALAHQALDDGARGLVALGTTAEPSSLTPVEQQAVLGVVTRVSRERHAPLVVGANTPQALQALADHPEVVASLTVVPSFVRPGEEGALAYLTRLAADSPVPLVVYDIPYRTGQYLSAGTLRRLADVPGVVGLKYAAGGINADTVELFADLPADLAILGGDDAFISPLLALGAHGGILASAHVATAEFARLIDAWHAGDVAVARALGGRLGQLSAALFAEPNPTVVKAVLHAQGRIPTPDVRLPLLPAHPDSTSAALTAVERLPATQRA